jgi:hypothetical protein
VWKDVLANVLTQWIVGPQVAATDHQDAGHTGGFTVSLRRVTPAELAAAAKDPKVADALRLRSAHAFIQKEAGPGNPPPHRVVFIEDWTLMGLISGATVPGMPMRLFAINSDNRYVQEEGKKPNAAILLAGSPGAPSEAKETDGRSVGATVGIAAAAIAVVGGVYLVTRKKGAAPPRMEG